MFVRQWQCHCLSVLCLAGRGPLIWLAAILPPGMATAERRRFALPGNCRSLLTVLKCEPFSVVIRVGLCLCLSGHTLYVT